MASNEFNAAAIQTEYQRLGYRHGWSFMATPECTLREARVVIVGLNPGGGGVDDHYSYQGLWDSPGGNAYFVEKWARNGTETPVQSQVKAWHTVLRLGADETLCAQFIPFRSPDWDRLERKNEAIGFSQGLWRWVLDTSPATLFLTMGKLPSIYLVELMGARLVASLPTNWGSHMIDVWDDANGRRIVRMPHPSRYQLFERENGASSIAEQSLKVAGGIV